MQAIGYTLLAMSAIVIAWGFIATAIEAVGLDERIMEWWRNR